MAYGTLNTDIVQSSTAGTPPQFNDGNGTATGTLCRAWVNFNGVTTTTIRGSFNVSSVTRNTTGDYIVTFTNAMADANYSAVVQQGRGTVSTTNLIAIGPLGSDPTTTTFRIGTYNSSFAAVDAGYVNLSVFR